MNRYSLVFAILFLCFIASLPVYAQPETTIGPVTGPVPPADIEAWMLSGDYHFHREGWWLGGYSNTMMLKSGDTDVFVKDLTEQQKTYIWERMTPEQRRQMGDEYGKIGFGMGGHLQQRPAEWGQLLNARIAEYFRGVSGWAEVAKQRHEAKIPQEAKDFAIDKDNFLQNNKDKLTQEQIVRIQKGADAVAKLADIIATIELKRIEIAVKGLSGGLIGIITDYCTGFVTHGANYVSDAIATILGKMIDIGRNAAGKSLSPGDQIALLNQQLALANGTLNDEIAKERVMWAQILAGQEPQEPPPPDQANVAVSILFLVDCSGSMRGAKIDRLKEAVSLALDKMAPDDLVSVTIFSDSAEVIAGGGPLADKRRTLDGKVQRMRAGGGTQMSRGMSLGLREVYRAFANERVNQVLLLTDGQTYGDEAQCLKLAKEAGEHKIPIQALGLGDDWNEKLLDEVGRLSGGDSDLVESADEIVPLFTQTVERSQKSVVRNAQMILRLVGNVVPRQVTGRSRVAGGLELGGHAYGDRYVVVELPEVGFGLKTLRIVEIIARLLGVPEGGFGGRICFRKLVCGVLPQGGVYRIDELLEGRYALVYGRPELGHVFRTLQRLTKIRYPLLALFAAFLDQRRVLAPPLVKFPGVDFLDSGKRRVQVFLGAVRALFGFFEHCLGSRGVREIRGLQGRTDVVKSVPCLLDLLGGAFRVLDRVVLRLLFGRVVNGKEHPRDDPAHHEERYHDGNDNPRLRSDEGFEPPPASALSRHWRWRRPDRGRLFKSAHGLARHSGRWWCFSGLLLPFLHLRPASGAEFVSRFQGSATCFAVQRRYLPPVVFMGLPLRDSA